MHDSDLDASLRVHSGDGQCGAHRRDGGPNVGANRNWERLFKPEDSSGS